MSSVWGSQITGLIRAGFGTPITKTILFLQPNLTWAEANKHAWIIYGEAERTGIDWRLIVAITFQESSFRYFKGDRSCGLTLNGTEACVYRAFGPMHVYWEYWKEKLQLDPKRFISDLKYQYWAGVQVLVHRWKRFKKFGEEWIGTYNSLNPIYRRRYAAKINQHLKRINQFITYQLMHS